MAIVQNTYTGNGSTTIYSLSFSYLDQADVVVTLNGTVTTAYTFVNANNIQFNTAPGAGVIIKITRSTAVEETNAEFYPGSTIRAQDLNDNFTQLLYVAQEVDYGTETANTTANTALTTANSATATANAATATANSAVTTANTASANASAAVTTANTASTNASNAVTSANSAVSTANTANTNASSALTAANNAVSTANTASTNASNAVTTANSATSTANTALSTANTANTNASTALSTANSATSTANTALSTANTANTNASNAVSTANAAAAAVASVVLYTIVANVAAIPASPTNNQAIEVTNSTGIESFTPLTGVPAGFVGSSGLSVRILYQSAGSTWVWVQYFPNDPENRYLKLAGGTLTGQLRADDSTSTAVPVYSFDGDTDTGIAHTGANELALVTGGTARLTIDPSGSITSSGTNTAASFTPTSSTVPTNGVYLPAANSVAISTNSTGRLFVDASGNVAIVQSPITVPSYTKSFNVSGLNASIALRANSTGTYSDQGIFFAVDGTNYSQIYNDGVGQLIFRTGSGLSERLRITSAGRVGIGTTSPAGTLDVVTGTNRGYFDDSAGSLFRLNAINAANSAYAPLSINGSVLTFQIGATERARIDSSGRLLVGTSTTLGTTAKNIESVGNIAISSFIANAFSYELTFNKSRGATNGTVVLSNDEIGKISFRADDGTDTDTIAAQITAAVDGTPGANDMPGRLVFSTTADGASSPTERMRINSSGQIITTNSTFVDPAITGTILEDVFTITDGVAFEIDPSNGSVQLITLGASRTPKATNFLAGESITLMVDDGTAYTLTWTDTTFGTSGVIWVGGTAPTLATTGYTVIQLWKVGTQVYGARVGNA